MVSRNRPYARAQFWQPYYELLRDGEGIGEQDPARRVEPAGQDAARQRLRDPLASVKMDFFEPEAAPYLRRSEEYRAQ
jgi:hypothetical protein